MQKTKLHYLKQMWFYLHFTDLILAWNSTKSTPLNGHDTKLQFSTYTQISHAQNTSTITATSNNDNETDQVSKNKY